jgi:hypothetical protein
LSWLIDQLSDEELVEEPDSLPPPEDEDLDEESDEDLEDEDPEEEESGDEPDDEDPEDDSESDLPDELSDVAALDEADAGVSADAFFW